MFVYKLFFLFFFIGTLLFHNMTILNITLSLSTNFQYFLNSSFVSYYYFYYLPYLLSFFPSVLPSACSPFTLVIISLLSIILSLLIFPFYFEDFVFIKLFSLFGMAINIKNILNPSLVTCVLCH